MKTEKKYRKVFFEIWTKDGYKGNWLYGQRHMAFGEADVPKLFERRPYKDKEIKAPEYLYRIDKKGIHIALFYDGLPEQTVNKTEQVNEGDGE